ncbi:MAG TPA: LytR C-terminal domain-containing protein [Coriobacteriia bacterium]
MSAFWSRSKRLVPAREAARDARREAEDARIEARQALSADPPQSQRLFDADDYVDDYVNTERADGASESPPVTPVSQADEAIPGSVPPQDDAPAADAEPTAGDGPDAVHESDSFSEPGTMHDPDTHGAHAPARHVRRRMSRRAHPHTPAPSGTGRHSAGLPDPARENHADTEAAASVERPTTGLAATVREAGRRILAVMLIIVVLLGSVFGLALGVNAFARWNARRLAALGAAPASPVEDNLLIIGVSDGVAVGFTALKAERSSKRVLGIAIPDGAFMEVPGQGFERAGASYVGGATVSKDTVSNYLGVPFRKFIVVDGAAYQQLLKDQDIAAVMGKVIVTDLTAGQRDSFTQYFSSVAAKDVWIVPLPVKPVAVGDQQYFEPQRAQVADLLLQWWGVQPAAQKATPRVIVYNGVGTPGEAGVAAQQLIKAGLRVVDSGNADNFDHKETLILVYHGTSADAQSVRTALGVGRIVVQSAPQNLTDMIVIIGADYRPPTSDASTVPTEGVQ